LTGLGPLVRAAALAGALMPWLAAAALSDDAPTILPGEWADFSEAFLAPSGRIVDTGNGGISHSEGQGYGLLLAFLAGMRPDFERIWRFTLTEMMIRDDGLVAWRWDPETSPHITDVNNASDGDILIAYALAKAGAAWNQPVYSDAAAELTRAIGTHLVRDSSEGPILLPGASGFSAEARADGPVVNLSYWVFEAFPVLASIDPDHDWGRLSDSGMRLVREVRLGARQLPPDWLSLAGAPELAAGMPAEFGYNALRVPLYLVRSGDADPPTLARFLEGMSGDGAVDVIDLASDRVRLKLDEPGYRAIPALLACVLGKGPLSGDLATFRPTRYYPSTLHLLVLSHARKELPQCL
jgi:endoglucanase